MSEKKRSIPNNATACLILADGTVFFGEAFGAEKQGIGEICFTTGMTGYQETLTDPSFADQIITFTFPHIGNVGCNDDDIEASVPHCSGLVVRERPTLPSSFRSKISLDEWLKKQGIPGIFGVDTRALTRHIRKTGGQNAMIMRIQDSGFGIQEAQEELSAFPNMNGRELAASVTTQKPYEWAKGLWKLSPATRNSQLATNFHVVAIDYGAKHNILRSLAERGLKVTVVPAQTSAEEILKYKPNGIFLSNGPGDPAATGVYAIPVIKELIAYQAPSTKHHLPIFGICLGHQLLGLALGGKTEKMPQGHRGMNHPVKDLQDGRVLITSQNHGFVVAKDGLPGDVEITHISLFDGSIQGLRHKTKPIFCMQGHPEASPGPHDAAYLFDRFVGMIEEYKSARV